MQRAVSSLLSLLLISLLLSSCGAVAFNENSGGADDTTLSAQPAVSEGSSLSKEPTVSHGKEPTLHKPDAKPDTEKLNVEQETIYTPSFPTKPEEQPETEEPLFPKSYRLPIDPEKPMVALTYDDGPHKTNSNKILDIIEKHHVTATFFEVGKYVELYPDIVRRAADMGCEIGSHSLRHADLSKLSAQAIQNDLAAADEKFINAIGTAPTLLRPPYGAVNKAVRSETGKTIINWSIDTEDWRSRDKDKILASVQNFGDLNGHVILLHSTIDATVEATEELIPWLLDQGYQLVTVSELITLHYGDTVDPNRLYGYSYFTF